MSDLAIRSEASTCRLSAGFLASVKVAVESSQVRHEPTSGYEDPALNYRVTWRAVGEGGATHERIFISRDAGWDFKVDMEKSANAYAVTWEHIPAQS